MGTRVDDLPAPLRPVVALYGWIAAAAIFVLWLVLRSTLRIRHVNRVTRAGPVVECAWHEANLPYIAAAMPYPRPYVWLNHPAWYMKGVHVFLRWMGVRRIALGSSGHGGREALAALVPLVAAGSSTFLNPDGPHGPAREVKDGVLELSLRARAPVVALHVRCARAWRLPTWERKLLPLPGSRVEIEHSPPWLVTPENREAVRAAIRRHLDGGSAAGGA